jgi:hypothetical protein
MISKPQNTTCRLRGSTKDQVWSDAVVHGSTRLFLLQMLLLLVWQMDPV